MDLDCVQLSIEGERLLKAHDYKGAIEFFEAALRQGTDDSHVLSAVYNQLGNACFYCNQYNKALEYHKLDLQIAEKLADKQGMAKAHGNLGNTFKSLKDYQKAVFHCETHLDLTRQLNDRFGEGRACYNLGNVYHAHGKSLLTKRDPESQKKGREFVMKAIEYYKSTLEITRALNDIAGEGRAVGNLGNAFTAIGEFQEAIVQHKRRYEIAVDANDLAAKARACGNLGNAYSALGDYIDAINYYQQSLKVAEEDRNVAAQGQAFFCLGCTYNLQKNYTKGVENHKKYLSLMEEINDSHGKLRAWHNLRNTYGHLKNIDKKIEYHELIQEEQRKQGEEVYPNLPEQTDRLKAEGKGDDTKKSKGLGGLLKKKKAGEVEAFSIDDSDDDEIVSSKQKTSNDRAKTNAATKWLEDSIQRDRVELQQKQHAQKVKSHMPGMIPRKDDVVEAPFDLFDMLAQANHSSLEDQRAVAPMINGSMWDEPDPSAMNSVNMASTQPYNGEEDIFDMIVGMQSHKIDDQRAGVHDVSRNAAPTSEQPEASNASSQSTLQDQLDPESMSFFEMLALAKNGGK
eukprot:m.12794 g.12794  ORF g.12794 m.12794 type:complete len:570 (+) comp4060_c0_seq1:30-1739(+)